MKPMFTARGSVKKAIKVAVWENKWGPSIQVTKSRKLKEPIEKDGKIIEWEEISFGMYLEEAIEVQNLIAQALAAIEQKESSGPTANVTQSTGDFSAFNVNDKLPDVDF